MKKKNIVLFLVVLSLLFCLPDLFGQSGVALDAWKRGKNLEANTYTKSEVDSRILETDASYTLSLGFTTDSVATHSLLSASHNSTVIASSAYVDGRISECDASNTLALSFTTDSVATHSLLSNTHNSTTIASEAYVTGYAHPLGGSTTIDLLGTAATFSSTVSATYFHGDGSNLTGISATGLSGNAYRLAAGTASEAIYLNGTSKDIAVASGSNVRFEIDFAVTASGTLTTYGGKLSGLARAWDTTAVLVGSDVEVFWKENAGLFGISAGISGGNLGVYASGTANSLWKIQSTKYWSLDDEP
jgi:hypothetical protein